MKNSPPIESYLEFSNPQNYEKITEHPLTHARKIHKSVHYQAFFCFFFEFFKNEEGPKFSFLDSLNLYKKEGK